MLRYRELSQKGTQVILKSTFFPTTDAELNGEVSSVLITWSPQAKTEILKISRVRNNSKDLPFIDTVFFYPLPELEDIISEVNYLFKLILTLKPYETSSQVPQDPPALSH